MVSGLQLPGCCYKIACNALDNGLLAFLDAFFRGLAVMENAHLPAVPCNRFYLAVSPRCSIMGQTEIREFGKTLARIFDGINA